jgi:2-keto-4-pentenoate hydratase/2-oxohepta-3-ene-1,7-dioic acid hydratase in catechol pathway
MRIVRFRYKKEIHTGALEEKHIRVLDHRYRDSGDRVRADRVSLLTPVDPGKIVCVGLNYTDHALEMNMPLPAEPVLFLKPPSALIGHGQAIVRPCDSGRVDHEAELGIVIRATARKVTPQSARSYILGYTCVNDVTARDLQKKDGQWTRAKAFDTFCPVGPWIETSVPDPDCLSIRAFVNDEVRQDSSTSKFVFGVEELVSFISRVMTLNAGDLIATGTPAGIGPLKAGDTVTVTIGSVGSLTNTVEDECRED